VKKIKILLIVLLVFVFSMNVNAACTDQEIKDLVSQLRVGYAPDSDHEMTSTDGTKYVREQRYAYLIYTYPYSEKLRITVKDSISNTTNYAEKSEYYDAFEYGSIIHYQPKTYTISVYGSESSACPNELISSLKYTVPAFNEYSMYSYCDENPDEDICSIAYDTSKMTQKDFQKVVEETEERKKIENMSTFQKIFYYIGKYWYFVIIPILVVSAIYGLKIFKYKEKVRKQ